MSDKRPIQKLLPKHLSAVQVLLSRTGLPYNDLIDSHVLLFGIFDDKHLWAVGGFELFPDCAFLRSIAIKPERQNKGHGARLVNHLEQTIKKTGISDLYLLTFSAERFFERLSWKTINRRDVPGSIRQTAQFNGLCPASAIAMHKKIKGK